MNEEAISYIMQKMSNCLDNSQMIRLEGRSEKTLFLYKFNIGKILEKSDRNVCVMNTDDIRQYLSEYQLSGVSKATVRRHFLKSILIKDTTKDEREEIIKSSLDCGGGCENCSSCWLGGGSPWDIYQDYIDGKKELKELNAEYMERYRQDRQIM